MIWKVFGVFSIFLVTCSGSPASKLDINIFINPIRGRIAGGTEASTNQFPYQVAFFVYTVSGQSVCGGSILSANFILSAAHCFITFESADLLAGIHNILNQVPAYELEVYPSDIIFHAQYNPQTQLNDIALVRTSRRPIAFSAAIQPLPLIPRSMANTDLTNVFGRVAGWGRTSDANSNISPVLLFIDSPIISNAACAATYGNSITASNICISGSNGRSTCQGDSGGPLTITSGGRQIQVGIVSFGSERGCQFGFATAFARITAFHDWIQTNTGIVIS